MALEGKGSFFILLIIVAILSLTLAGLAAYVFLTDGLKAADNTTQAAAVKESRPSDDNLVVKKVFEEKKFFNLKSTDPKKVSVIQVGVEIIHLKSTKTVKDVAVKITLYDGAIKELIGSYFQQLTIDDVKLTETKAKAKTDLKKEINKLIGAEKEELVYEINFDDWFYQ